METTSMLQVICALLFVTGLIGVAGLLAKKFRLDQRLVGGLRKGARLQVQEALALDARHRLLLLRCDAQEHLILLGPGQPVILEHLPQADQQQTNIKEIIKDREPGIVHELMRS